MARLCKLTSIAHVAEFYALACTTVKLIDWRSLERELGPVDLAQVRAIAMDEFAIQKGHHYATVVVEPLSKRVLWGPDAAGAGKTFGPSSSCSAPRAARTWKRSRWT